MDNRAFAKQIYEFIKENDEPGRFEGFFEDESISEIEAFLSDLALVT